MPPQGPSASHRGYAGYFMNLHIPFSLTRVRLIIKRATLAVLPLITVFLSAQAIFAQDLQVRPVARLLSDPVLDASYSRPRRVASEVPSTDSASISLAEPSMIERNAFEKINRTRVASGLAPLTWDAALCRMARAHSEHMASRGYFSHETPDGDGLKQRARAMSIGRFRVIAENIAYNKGYEDPGAFAVERWMLSSGHRANILYEGFQASAIGSYVAADGSVYLTQVFIAR